MLVGCRRTRSRICVVVWVPGHGRTLAYVAESVQGYAVSAKARSHVPYWTSYGRPVEAVIGPLHQVWTPGRLTIDFPNGPRMRVSHESGRVSGTRRYPYVPLKYSCTSPYRWY